MRLGLISDVHANLPALRAALHHLTRLGVDRILCTGDIVGYGPHPNECVATLAEREALCVAGNHDLMCLGKIPQTHAGPLARRTLDWTREVLGADSRNYLTRLPRVAGVSGVVLAHGSLADPEEYVQVRRQAVDQLRCLAAEHPDARVLMLGHTHRSWLVSAAVGTVTGPHRVRHGVIPLRPGDRTLVNPGAVGQSRTLELRPRVRFALLDLERDEVRLLAEHYDVSATRRALQEAGLPAGGVHRRPRVRKVAGRMARRLSPGCR